MALLTFCLIPAGTHAIEFERDIQPILSQHCTSCHGGVKQQGGLSFLSEPRALTKLKSGNFAIVPGDVSQSELIARITHADPEEAMPPEGERLSETDIQHLKQWIKEGAAWPAHWAFRKPQQHAVPKTNNKAWPINEIDAFVLSNLESRDIAPSPMAKKVTQLRRASLDIIGLLPRPEEVETFLADKAEAAGEKQIDR
jgi:cytochrome c553